MFYRNFRRLWHRALLLLAMASLLLSQAPCAAAWGNSGQKLAVNKAIDTLPPDRSSNLAPTSSSSDRICEEIAGCVRKRFSAAREKLERRATSMNVSS